MTEEKAAFVSLLFMNGEKPPLLYTFLVTSGLSSVL